MTITTSYRRHLGKTIACCLLLMPCHAADTTIQLNVHPVPGNPFKIDVSASATVGDVKQAIQDQQSIARDPQKIILNGKTLVDGELLTDHRIKDQSTINLMWTFRLLHIKYNGTIFDVAIKPSATIGELKDAIAQKGNAFPRQHLTLHYNNNTLLDDAQNLSQIAPEDTIQLLIVRPLSNNHGNLNTNPNINLINPNPTNANTTHASDTTNNNHLTTPPNDPKKYILPIAALVVTLCLIGMVISPFSADHKEASPHTQRPPKKTSPPSQKRKKNTPSRKKRTPKTT